MTPDTLSPPARRGILRADGLLLLTAIIWGFAFSAQRSGMEHIGPLAYSAIRFAIGGLSMLPLMVVLRRQQAHRQPVEAVAAGRPPLPRKQALVWTIVAGIVLFSGAILQQAGLVSTTAGNAGFITSLYVVLVPIIGTLFGKRTSARIWAGAILALAGLYILSVGAGFSVAPGDLLVLIGSFFWAAHILIIARVADRMDALAFALGQYLVVSGLSLIGALIFEPAPFAGTLAAAIPILYGGLLSIGVAFTLQIIAQKTAHPAHASIILSMEALFAAVGGVLILAEPVTTRLVAGGALMLLGMIISQTGERA